MPRRPAEHERSKDDGDCAQSLSRPVLLLLLLFPAQSFRLGARIAATVTRYDEVPERRDRHSRQRASSPVQTGSRLGVFDCDRHFSIRLPLAGRRRLYRDVRFIVDRYVSGGPRRRSRQRRRPRQLVDLDGGRRPEIDRVLTL